ncbi:Beta-galactosidase 4 [Hibiscus syriacus]|uniref:beta-galactosidase n=1 Tax=Hibiscus syriacus TaxID=106335 RepID=A0A6A3A5L7_HIBSY|nr:Beta-galactosidase 4 [Hibiscus syriacus]
MPSSRRDYVIFCCSDFAYNYLEGTIPSECASMNLTFASIVTYDIRAIVIDGKRHVLVFGSIHYPRNTPDMWSDLIQKSKDEGLDMIETYVFWNLHEPVRKQVIFMFICASDHMFVLNGIMAYGAGAKPYNKWAADMAISLDTGVPWVMFQQSDAPDPIISLGFQDLEDLAFAVARFYQRGGTFQNYYMYQGGMNFGRTTGGPFIATSYDYDAPIDEYGLVRQPKWDHLRDVHKAIKLCEEALIATDPTISSLGPNLEINSQTVIPSFMHESLNTNANSTDSSDFSEFSLNSDFAYNYLEETIPSECASMNLIFINLEANQFSGLVPPALGDLVNLETLMLSSNQLTQNLTVTFSLLRNLSDLRISDINGPSHDFLVLRNMKCLLTLVLRNLM